MRVVPPLRNGGVVHLFVIYGNQGAESDQEKLTLTDYLLAAVLAEAKMYCAGQPGILVGDLKAVPSVIPSHGVWIDVDKAFASGRGVAPALTCNSKWMRIRAHEGTSLLLALMLWRPPLHVAFCQIAGFPRILQSARSSLFLHGRPVLTWPESAHPSGQPVGLNVQIAPDVLRFRRFRISGTSTSKKSPWEVREQLFIACNSPDVDASWLLWSQEAEASLAGAYLSAGGPSLSNPSSYVGRGQLSLRTKRLGGRCRDRIYRMDRADNFDVTNSGFFVNSSLAPVLRFRRWFVSVCNVVRGMNLHVFLQTPLGQPVGARRLSGIRMKVASGLSSWM